MKKTERPMYTLRHADPGNYRVYYRSRNRQVRCIQNDGSWGRDDFKFYVCSRDGEPSYPMIAFPDDDDFDQLVFPPSIEKTI